MFFVETLPAQVHESRPFLPDFHLLLQEQAEQVRLN